MKSFKIREGKMLVDGVFYSDKPSENVIMGKWGRIHSINVMGKQMFPYGGVFDDGTTPIPSEPQPSTDTKKKSLPKTELVEKSGVAVDESGKLVKKSRKKK